MDSLVIPREIVCPISGCVLTRDQIPLLAEDGYVYSLAAWSRLQCTDGVIVSPMNRNLISFRRVIQNDAVMLGAVDAWVRYVETVLTEGTDIDKVASLTSDACAVDMCIRKWGAEAVMQQIVRFANVFRRLGILCKECGHVGDLAQFKRDVFHAECCSRCLFWTFMDTTFRLKPRRACAICGAINGNKFNYLCCSRCCSVFLHETFLPKINLHITFVNAATKSESVDYKDGTYKCVLRGWDFHSLFSLMDEIDAEFDFENYSTQETRLLKEY